MARTRNHRKAVIEEDAADVTMVSSGDDDGVEAMDASRESLTERQQEKRQQSQLKAELVRRVGQCVMGSCTKRGFCRDGDIAEVFTDRGERELRELVLKKVVKVLKETFGFQMERDEEGKRWYLYNVLESKIAQKISQKLDEDGEHRLHQREYRDEGDNDDDEEEEDEDFDGGGGNSSSTSQEDEGEEKSILENVDAKRWLCLSTLMFIFMTKRHTEIRGQEEKGVDWMLIKEFLTKMFTEFGMDPLTDKQLGDLFGPAKSAEFIAQGWLRCTLHLDQAAGIEEAFYFWGPHAEKVINKQEMLQEFCTIYKSKPKEWPNHAKKAGLRHAGSD